jgi:hypothetical protein
MRTPYEIGCATAYCVKRADLLTGGAIGAGLGGLYGLINPEVTRELDPTDPKRKRVIDKKHYVSSALSNMVLGGIGGAALGHTLRGRGGRASAPDVPSTPQTPPKDPTSSSSSLLLPDEWRGNITLRPYLEDAYGAAPGGLPAAVAAAEKYKPEAVRKGLHTFNTPADFDTPVTVSNKKSDWIRFVDAFTRRGGKSTGDSNTAKDWERTGAVTRGGRVPEGESKIIVNAASPSFTTPAKRLRVLRHELTHAAYEPSIFAAQDKRLFKGDAPGVNYIGHASELAAHLAEAKRDYVKQTGKQVNTPADAEKVLEHFERDSSNKGDALYHNLPSLKQYPDLKKLLLLQILSIVKGQAHAKSDTDRA